MKPICMLLNINWEKDKISYNYSPTIEGLRDKNQMGKWVIYAKGHTGVQVFNPHREEVS